MFNPDPLQTGHEERAKAKMDYEAVLEANRRATAAAENEITAPLVERTRALPERLDTLRYLSPEDQQMYGRDFDGSFVLRYVRITDEASTMAHVERIGKSITVLGADETPASRKAQQIRQQEMTDKVNAILADTARKEAEAKLAAEEARLQQEGAKLEAERERIRRQYKTDEIYRESY